MTNPFHSNLKDKGIGAKDWANTFTEVEYLGEGKFAASVGVGHRVFKDKEDDQWKKRKLTDNRPGPVVIQSAKCCVEVYPYYAKYFDVHHEEVRLYEERWVVQRWRDPPGTWGDVGAWNPVMAIEEYSEPAGDVIKVTVTYETDYGILVVEYFQRDGNALKHNVYFTNTSGSTEIFRVLQRWAGIMGEKCNDKTPAEFVIRDGIYHQEILPKIVSLTPGSVLDVGGGRGELVKDLNDEGITATCMEKSEYCWDNRVTDNFVRHDATIIPWPFTDNEFDLCTGIGVLKYIPEDKLDDVLREIARVSERGLFCLGPGFHSYLDSGPIVTNRPLLWWQARFQTVVPDYPVEIETIKEVEFHLAFHRTNDTPKDFSIAENLGSMIFNPDGSEKTDQCLQLPILVETHAQGMKADFVYSQWILANNEELTIDPDTATFSDPTEDGYIWYDPVNSPYYFRNNVGEYIRIGLDWYGNGAIYRAYVEWNVSSLVGATITDTVFRYHGKQHNPDCHIHEMLGARPSTSTPQEIWDEAGEGNVYADPAGFPIVGINQSQDLGAQADTDLQAQLGAGWFAIGIQADDETEHNAEFTWWSEIYSEDFIGPPTPKPTLYVVYTPPAAEGGGAGAVAEIGVKSLILDLLLEGVLD